MHQASGRQMAHGTGNKATPQGRISVLMAEQTSMRSSK